MKALDAERSIIMIEDDICPGARSGDHYFHFGELQDLEERNNRTYWKTET